MHQTVGLRWIAKLQIFFQINSHVVNHPKNRFYFCIFAYYPVLILKIKISFENAHHLFIKSLSTRYYSHLMVRTLTFAKRKKCFKEYLNQVQSDAYHKCLLQSSNCRYPLSVSFQCGLWWLINMHGCIVSGFNMK